MKTFVRVVVLCLVVPAGAVFAQSSGGQMKPAQEKPAAPQGPTLDPQNPLTSWNKNAYARIKGVLLKSAEKMPEENFSFRPTDAVRTYGQILGHVADAQYLFCSQALGETGPKPDIEHTKTSKADLTAALTAAFAYCDKAYDGMTDASAVQVIKFFGNDSPRFATLEVNNIHNMEHYGNLATYMRMKNIVPPSSENQQAPPAAQKK